jgi:uncharacterized beta-barrel protein YwiB (DUF1934 family)
MEKVLIEVIGTQNIDSQFDKTELKTVGTFEELEEKYIIRYKEEQGEGEAPVDVSVVVLKDESVVEMTRDGAISSRLVIERSQRNLCHYGTAYGEISGIFKARKQVNLDKVKMPKAVSRTKAKNGVISYDCDSLANRFGALYPEFKEDIKKNIVKYGEFLPETFFTEIGTPKVIDVIKNGNSADQKKLFKMLNEVYEDGTNEVQDVIGVTILGAMQNDKDMMAVADKYMSDYMSGPVHEINKLTAKKGSSLMKKLKNPPAYKPKKKKNNFMQNALQAQDINR